MQCMPNILLHRLELIDSPHCCPQIYQIVTGWLKECGTVSQNILRIISAQHMESFPAPENFYELGKKHWDVYSICPCFLFYGCSKSLLKCIFLPNALAISITFSVWHSCWFCSIKRREWCNVTLHSKTHFAFNKSKINPITIIQNIICLLHHFLQILSPSLFHLQLPKYYILQLS